jgi:hypothetical protein
MKVLLNTFLLLLTICVSVSAVAVLNALLI